MPELGIGLGITKGAAPKTKLLLDKYDIDAAFSLRKVRADYNGPCVRVRNSSGDFADIGFTSSGVLDEAALNAHCGDNDGTVQTWYNQSTEGGRYNAVQDTAADQPIIYDASAGGYLGYLENTGNMYLRFENQLTGVTDAAVVYENTTVPGGVGGSAYVVGEHEVSANGGDGILVGHNSVSGFVFQPSSGSQIQTHTGEGQNDKHAGFVYTGGSDKFAVVDGYVCGESSNAGSANFDYIFTKAKSSGGQDGYDFVGKIWEVFLSTSDLSDKRIQLENSILLANGLTVPDQTLLEKYDGAAAAYSLRCVNRSHVGPIIELRATQTTEVTEDVYLDSTGVINESRITALCTDDEDGDALVDGFVEAWYDQSGNANDAEQTTDANQPKIHDATDGVVLENGKPTISNWVSATTILTSNFGQTYNDVHVFSVSRENGGTTVGYIVSGNTSNGFRVARNGQGSDVWLYDGAISKSTTAENYTQALVSATNETNPAVRFNGAIRAVDNTLNGNGMSGAYIGNHPTLSVNGNIDGNLQELIIYSSYQSDTNREGIESNINAHYLIYQEATASPASGLLSEHSGASAAYSVRQLGDANICMRVRRDGDDAEKNIGFGGDGFVDTTAISDFCGSDDGFVVTWFDQSGNAVDATQDAPADQPKIYDGTDGIVLENGKPKLTGDGTKELDISISIPADLGSFFAVNKPTSTGDEIYALGTNFRLRTSSGNHGYFAGSSYVTSTENTSNELAIRTAIAGTTDSTGQNGGSFTTGNAGSSGTTLSSIIVFDSFQEFIVYDTDQSADRTDIESNVNDAFDIYPSTETPTSGFLGEFSGAAAAYSVRKLGDSPVAMRVRKTVTAVDYYQVIGFDSNGDLDTAAIEEFGGSNDVFVQTWYDQSGNGRHQVQDTNAEQPKIYDGTDGFYYTEGNVAIFFDDQGMEDSSDNQITVLDQSIFVVAERSSTVDADRSVFVGHSEDATYQVFAAQVWGGATDDDPDLIINFAGTVQSDRATAPLALDTKQNLRTYGWHHDDDSIFQYNGEEFAPDEDENDTLNPTQSTYQISVGSKSYNALEAYVTEVIVYEGMRDATTRANVEKNQNNYFLVHQEASASPATGLLSEAPNATAAYSVRQLGDAKLCMKVRRDSDDATKNIGFKNGVVDTAAIEAFCGNSDGTVDTWYDQSGSGNHATQGTAGSQPKIYDNATGIVTENGKPAVEFDSDFLSSPNTDTFDELSVFVAAVKPNTQSNSAFVSRLGDSSGSGEKKGDFHLRSDSAFIRTIAGNSDGSQYTFTEPNALSVFSFLWDGSVQSAINTPLGDGEAVVRIDSTIVDQTASDGNFNVGSDELRINYAQSVATDVGKYQEVLVYNSDQSSNREDIETNINNHFKIYTPFTTGLLDSYPGAAAAYSLRRLSSTYTGPAIEVTSNSSTQDIGFDTEGNLDTSTLAAFCGSNDGTVSKWYDQSGGGNDAAQATVASQPKIYDGTDGVVLENGKPILSFAANNKFDLSSNLSILNENFFYVTAETVDLTVYGLVDDTDYLRNQLNRYLLSDGGTLYQSNISPSSGYSVHSVINNDGAYQNGTRLADFTNTLTISADSILEAHSAGSYQELVIYDSDQSSNRTGIEKNINKHYSIYDQPLLDVVPDAAAAYSLRKLRADYTGPAINVYNGTDYKDIYFRANGTLDTNAISKFCGSNDGTVAIWYDQSGSANHAEQTTVASQPKIYDGTTGVELENSLAAMTITDGQGFTLDSAVGASDNKYAFLVHAVDSADTSWSFFGDPPAVQATPLAEDGSTSSTLTSNDFVPLNAIYKDGGALSLTTRDALHADYVSAGQSLTVIDFEGTPGVGILFNRGGGRNYTGTVQELVIYTDDKSSDRTVAEANTNRYYSIY